MLERFKIRSWLSGWIMQVGRNQPMPEKQVFEVLCFSIDIAVNYMKETKQSADQAGMLQVIHCMNALHDVDGLTALHEKAPLVYEGMKAVYFATWSTMFSNLIQYQAAVAAHRSDVTQWVNST
jgi:hypothetical protein